MALIVPEHQNLLELLKASLFNSIPNLSDDVNWDKVFESAKAQCIVPLVFPFVTSMNISEWEDISCQSKAHYMRMLYEQDLLVKLFNKHSIPFIVFKGTAAAIYYPIPSLRTYGDIDFFVPVDFLYSARRMLEDNGYHYISNNDRHYSYEKNGIEFELHNKISSIHYNDIDNIYIKGLENSVEYRLANCSFPGLPSIENGMVLLGHIIAHLKASGIGLRQIIDWMMFVHNELDDTVWENHFKVLATEAGLEKLAITVTYMCKKWIGLPDDITWCNGADEEVADQLLIRILDDGNFGQDRAPTESIKKSMKEEGIFRYLQRVGIDNWPSAHKYKILRPFACLYQLCRFIGKGISGLFTSRKILMKGKKIMSIDELLKELE